MRQENSKVVKHTILQSQHKHTRVFEDLLELTTEDVLLNGFAFGMTLGEFAGFSITEVRTGPSPALV